MNKPNTLLTSSAKCARVTLVVEVTPEAEQEWVEEIIRMSRLSESFQAECTPGYYNNEGKPNPKSVQNGSYGAGPVKFFKVIEDWRAQGTLPGLELR